MEDSQHVCRDVSLEAEYIPLYVGLHYSMGGLSVGGISDDSWCCRAVLVNTGQFYLEGDCQRLPCELWKCLGL